MCINLRCFLTFEPESFELVHSHHSVFKKVELELVRSSVLYKVKVAITKQQTKSNYAKRKRYMITTAETSPWQHSGKARSNSRPPLKTS